VHGQEFGRRVDEVASLADREMRTSSIMSSHLVDRGAAALNRLGNDAPMARNLDDLRRALDALDPGRHALSGERPKLLGIFALGDARAAYLERFQRAQGRIDEVVGKLHDAQRELKQENAALRQEQTAFWTQMASLRRLAYLAERLDTGSERLAASLDGEDPERARAIREDLLYVIRRRREAILSQLAVAQQGYAALGVMEANNDQLISALGAATTTTVAALRTAGAVAGALASRSATAAQTEDLLAVTGTALDAIAEVDTHKQRALREIRQTVPDTERG
jgi:uncharacterized protein YaaN involved in tellurite resistance